jgi:hypothetical protein
MALNLTATRDHAVTNASGKMDDGADFYRRLGFTLTGQGYRGSINHQALLRPVPGVAWHPQGRAGRPNRLLNFTAGLNGLVFGLVPASGSMNTAPEFAE